MWKPLDMKENRSGTHEWFACVHGEDGERNMAELVEEVKTRLSEPSDAFTGAKVRDDNLITAIVYSLEFNFNAHITGIYCDQWAAVSAEGYEFDEETKKFKETPAFRTYIQCDLVEHGFAATWKAFADHASPFVEVDPVGENPEWAGAK